MIILSVVVYRIAESCRNFMITGLQNLFQKIIYRNPAAAGPIGEGLFAEGLILLFEFVFCFEYNNRILYKFDLLN